MPAFSRSFATDILGQWDVGKSGNAVRALFDRWALPGQTSETPLRLGLRDGYLNFYIKGQSIAKLSCTRDGPKLSVHRAYAFGRKREGSEDRSVPIEGYQSYDSTALAAPQTAALIPGWIETAETYASAEKRFVDDLIAANPGVIDLEMGLPASDLAGSDRVAPRMDLVLVQVGADGSPAIVFWEAKCANNPEVRASGETAAKVVEQLAKYERWMDEDRIAQVQRAYCAAAMTMLDLYKLYRSVESEAPRCLEIWRTLANAPAPVIITQPGLVIGNYWPAGHTEAVASGRMRQSAASFARNGHGAKLESEGITVYQVGPDHAVPALPLLKGAAIAV
ncbi:hypothetical protein [Sphingomonas sp. PAMC 26605]|uniref:hypothetical protein n=1 Tax=Sphingomonas sp. PAMC 26605 TaxID=1112214 RepID=UPI00026CDE52|nr:hypothetical protein [Sphingomonas sp. PAMC 26605]